MCVRVCAHACARLVMLNQKTSAGLHLLKKTLGGAVGSFFGLHWWSEKASLKR